MTVSRLSEARLRVLALGGAIALAIVVFVPGLPGEFVYDDHRLIVDNDGLKRPFDPSRAFLRDYYASDLDTRGLGYYRPVAVLTTELDYRVGGGRSFPFHLTNMLLHVAATCLVFALARRVSPSGVTAPAVAAALFAIHPAHAESVAFISGRVDPLATVGVLATVLFHLRANSAPHPMPWRWAAAGAWLVGLFSKEMAVTAPLLAAVIEIGLEGWPSRRQWRERATRYVPYAATAAIYLVARVAGLGRLLAPPLDGPAASLATPILDLGTYLRWLVLPPFGLNLEPEPAGGGWMLRAIASLLVALLVAAWLWRRRLRVELSIFAAATIALLPVLQLKALETSLSERFLYLPSAFAMSLIGLLALRPRSVRARLVTLVSIVLLCGLYVANLVPRAVLWRDEVRLWTAKEREDGGSLKARLNLGRAHHSRGDDAAARSDYESAIRLAPGLEPQIRAEMGTLTGGGHGADPVDDVKRAIGEAPGDGSLWANLGFLLIERGDLPAASDAFARSTALSPLRATSWLGAALVKLRQGDVAGAEVAATRAYGLDPSLGLAQAVRGECLLRRGAPCEALKVLQDLRLEDPGQQTALDRVRAAAAEECRNRK